MRGLRLFLVSLSVVGISLCTVRGADAPPARLVIQSATYGDLESDNTVDVTHKIAEMVKDENLSVVASPKTFTDPAPKAAKKLRVGFTIDGIFRSKTVADGETLDISAKLIIVKATYGDLPKGPSTEVTEEVASLVRKNSLSVKASNEVFGDAAPNRVKQLRVDYLFAGKPMSKTAKENSTLTISNDGH